MSWTMLGSEVRLLFERPAFHCRHGTYAHMHYDGQRAAAGLGSNKEELAIFRHKHTKAYHLSAAKEEPMGLSLSWLS